jgi:hypothetical protein
MPLLALKMSLPYRYSVGGIGIVLETHFAFGFLNGSPVGDSLSNWWIKINGMITKPLRRALNSLIILGHGCFGNIEKDVFFNGARLMCCEWLQLAGEEPNLLGLAGAWC